MNNISKILHFALVRSHLKYKFQSLFRAAEEFEPDPWTCRNNEWLASQNYRKRLRASNDEDDTRIRQIMARIVDHLRCTTRAENGVVIIGLDEARTHAWMTTAKR